MKQAQSTFTANTDVGLIATAARVSVRRERCETNTREYEKRLLRVRAAVHNSISMGQYMCSNIAILF